MSEAKQISKRCLEAVVNHMPDPMFIIDANNIVVSWNRAMEKLLKVPAEGVIGKSVREISTLFYDEPRPLLANLLEHSTPEEEAKYENFIRCDDGSIEGFTYTKKWGLYLWAQALPFYDLEGNKIGIIEINRDVTEIRKQEIKYKELAIHQESLMRSIPDIVMETDINKVYIWSNEAGYEFFGDDVIGREANYYFLEGNEKTYEIVDKLFTGSDDLVHLDSKQRRKDGEGRCLSWWSKAIKNANGDVDRVISAARDITEEKTLRFALLESTQKYKSLFSATRAILDNVNLMIWAKDAENRYTFINKIYRDFLGVSTRDILGKKFEDFVDRNDFYCSDTTDEVAKNETFIDTIPVSYKGVKYWLAICKTPLRDECGLVVGTVGTARDVTDNIKRKEDIETQAIKLREEIEKGVVEWKSETEKTSIEVTKTIEEIRKSMHNVADSITQDDYWGKIL